MKKDLKEALNGDFANMDLRGVDFTGRNLSQANLTEANLQDTNIITAEFDNTVGIYPVCPDTGSVTGWTIGEDEEGNEYLVEIMLPWAALRNSGTTRRCRANAMHINGITPIVESLEDDECPNSVKLKNRDFKLNLGESAVDENFEIDRFKVSSTDLYFWISKEEALAHARKKI